MHHNSPVGIKYPEVPKCPAGPITLSEGMAYGRKLGRHAFLYALAQGETFCYKDLLFDCVGAEETDEWAKFHAQYSYPEGSPENKRYEITIMVRLAHKAMTSEATRMVAEFIGVEILGRDAQLQEPNCNNNPHDCPLEV